MIIRDILNMKGGEIFSIAPGHRWAVRFVSRGPLIAAPAAFAEHIANLGRQLDCAAWVL